MTLLILDLIGTFVFALSGAAAGVRNHLDLFGVLVLSFAAAAAGGITRDVIIGAVPPAAFSNWWYLAIAMFAGLLTFWRHGLIDRMRRPVLIFDAGGLALFAVTGTQKALEFGLSPVMAALIGMVSGIGGGMIRDIMLARIPTVLKSELYAVAALLGAVVVTLSHVFSLPATPMMILGALLCFTLRVAAFRYRLHLPIARRASAANDQGSRRS
ncbi:MAG: trimeric intracellular cation channel family protein [Gammaproteobacteria bacterium]|nr:trimeric intracellular cation channel family protein [Gammaproteobacteria bacterium]